jgi:hypothetical protein
MFARLLSHDNLAVTEDPLFFSGTVLLGIGSPLLLSIRFRVLAASSIVYNPLRVSMRIFSVQTICPIRTSD